MKRNQNKQNIFSDKSEDKEEKKEKKYHRKRKEKNFRLLVVAFIIEQSELEI